MQNSNHLLSPQRGEIKLIGHYELHIVTTVTSFQREQYGKWVEKKKSNFALEKLNKHFFSQAIKVSNNDVMLIEHVLYISRMPLHLCSFPSQRIMRKSSDNEINQNWGLSTKYLTRTQQGHEKQGKSKTLPQLVGI